MKAAVKTKHTLPAKIIVILVIIAALAVSLANLWERKEFPTTDAATIDADVVHIASEVGGRIQRIVVAENQQINKGDLIFQIDPEPFMHALEQATADYHAAIAQLETSRRVVATQQINVKIAAEQARKAAVNAELASRTVERLRPLAEKGYVSQQRFDQASSTEVDTQRTLTQANAQLAAARTAVDTTEGAQAIVQARKAAMDIAARALRQTTVIAPHNGRVVGLKVEAGEVLAPSQSIFTLIASDKWFAVGNFRETSLANIKEGDCATVFSMINSNQPIRGFVQGIGSGVLDGDRVDVPRSVPFVQRSLNWVRVSQRFPVRIRLTDPDPMLVRLGASAVIEIRHGAMCP